MIRTRDFLLHKSTKKWQHAVHLSHLLRKQTFKVHLKRFLGARQAALTCPNPTVTTDQCWQNNMGHTEKFYRKSLKMFSATSLKSLDLDSAKDHLWGKKNLTVHSPQLLVIQHFINLTSTPSIRLQALRKSPTLPCWAWCLCVGSDDIRPFTQNISADVWLRDLILL